MKPYGLWLARFRRQSLIDLNQLASYSGIPEAELQAMEKGAQEMPEAIYQELIELVLKITVDKWTKAKN